MADPFSTDLSAASYQPAYDGQFGWTRIINSNMTNQFSADLSHFQAIFTQVNPSVFPYSIVSTGFNLGIGRYHELRLRLSARDKRHAVSVP